MAPFVLLSVFTMKSSRNSEQIFMKSTIFWDITPCSPLSVKRPFGGTYRLHLQVRKTSLTSGGILPTCFHACFLFRLFFRPWRWRRYVPPKLRLTLNGLHRGISQKMVLFITTAVRTSNPTQIFMKFV
jgi:hypothetical protein